jgi:hypothetical protein
MGDMKYFVTTEFGEAGPYTAATLNRMFQKGQVRGDHLCREENSQQRRRLDDVFRHFAPSATVVVDARRNVARWNQNAGRASTNTGWIMVGIAMIWMILMQGVAAWTIAVLIVGIGLVVNGNAQHRRGKLAAAQLSELESPEAPQDGETEKPAGPPKTYDY